MGLEAAKVLATPVQNDAALRTCTFVNQMEELLEVFVNDNTPELKNFSKRYPKLSILSGEAAQFVHLWPMGTIQHSIVHHMLPHYFVEGEKMTDGKGRSYIRLKKTHRSMVANYLLSTAIANYQKYGKDILTLESCPPECMIVVDDASILSSGTVMDRLQAWSGSYKLWRNEENQLFIVFTTEELRNSALTEMSKFQGRKATAQDSMTAEEAQKKKQSKKKAQQKKKQKTKENAESSKKGNSKYLGDGWYAVGDTNVAPQDMPTVDDDGLGDLNLHNQFG
jgi:hypothetical protein